MLALASIYYDVLKKIAGKINRILSYILKFSRRRIFCINHQNAFRAILKKYELDYWTLASNFLVRKP
jgi:hypothetical protein